MKQGIIAFLVVLAGAAGVFGMLGMQSLPQTDAPEPKSVTLSLNPEKLRPVEPIIEDGISTDKADRVTPTETAAIPRVTVDPLIMQPTLIQPSANFLAGVTELSQRDSLDAIHYRDTLKPDSVEWQTLSWAIAISGQLAVPSQMIADTQARLKDWPGQKDLQENFEEALYRENPSANLVITAFGKAEPTTAEGAIILARAALATGDKARAATVIRQFWLHKRLDEAREDKITGEFGTLLTPADHKARMDYLLFTERYAQAKRFSVLGEAQSLYQAFEGVGRNLKGADKLIKSVDAKWRNDPSYLYLQIKRQRQLRNYEAAARLLRQTPKNQGALVEPGAWWVEARIVSRGLMDQGSVKDAYALASAHVARDADDIAEAEFHAGWYALRGLKDARKAEKHFTTLLRTSPKAHDQARGLYWLGRVAEAGGAGKAKDLFTKAAEYPATFYGQLAASRLKTQITPGRRYQATDSDRMAFEARPEIIGISLLEQAGEDSRARRLYLALAATIENPVELQLLANDALNTHGSTLALAIGKAALRQGHDPGLAAFPLGAIPETADISGSGKALAYAIARQESAFNPSAVSPANARGLLQLLPSTARRVAKQYQMAYADEKLTEDPAFNATLGSHYLGEQISKFDGSLIMTFAAYNAGPSRIPQWIKRYGDPRGKDIETAVDWVENIPFTETRDYVQRVMENYQIYKMLLNEKADIAADLTAGTR